MVYLITGGAGFIGRWVVKNLLLKNESLVIIDNLDNGRTENLAEFKNNAKLKDFIIGDIRDEKLINNIFQKYKFNCCIHLAAQINVQESLDNPRKAFEVNVIGTYYILEAARKFNTTVILIGTCMVYDLSNSEAPISENHGALEVHGNNEHKGE